MEEHKIKIEPKADGFIVKVDGKKYPPVRGNYFTAESDKIYAVEYSLKLHLGIRHDKNFRCEIDLDKEIAKVYYPILKVTWKEEKELERNIALNKSLSKNEGIISNTT
jgi:hypothetical protein